MEDTTIDMDKIEKIKTEIERHIKHYEKLERNDFQNGELYICQELLFFINSLSEEPDKGLEEAAEEYATTHLRNNEFPTADSAFIAGAEWQEKRDEETIKTAEDHAFLAGADWQTEQLMKGSVEGVVEDWNPEPHPEITIPLNPEEFTAGDRVKLIVIKEDDK